MEIIDHVLALSLEEIQLKQDIHARKLKFSRGSGKVITILSNLGT